MGILENRFWARVHHQPGHFFDWNVPAPFIWGRTNSADSAASVVRWSFFSDRHRGDNRAKGAPAIRLVLSGYRELAGGQYLLLHFPRLDDLS